MTTSLEMQLASELRNEISQVEIGETFHVSPSSALCSSLELFLPALLRKDYAEWLKESIDGVFVARAARTSLNGAQLVGTCILISDQTVTPFLTEMELSTESDAITSAKVLLGEQGGGGRLKISGPPCNSREAQRLLESIVERIDQVHWSYAATDGTEVIKPIL